MVCISDITKEIRKNIYKIAHHAGCGHLASAFSAADIVATLYFCGVLHYDPKNPDWKDRDIFILSKGHACYALYAALAMAGYFSKAELRMAGQPGALLGGEPKLGDIPGVEATTGSLGHGLSFAVGIAYADKVEKRKNHIYVLLGDGECQEGSVWEGALSAPTLELDNLTAIIDYNKLQAMDTLENVVRMNPFAEKWQTFGWNVIEIDGHDPTQIKEALLTRTGGRPTVVIAHTVKGKGISFMENVPIWHYRMPNNMELPILMKELGLVEAELA